MPVISYLTMNLLDDQEENMAADNLIDQINCR